MHKTHSMCSLYASMVKKGLVALAVASLCVHARCFGQRTIRMESAERRSQRGRLCANVAGFTYESAQKRKAAERARLADATQQAGENDKK